MPFQVTAVHSTREYEIQPRKHHRGVDLFVDVLPFGHLCYGELKGVSNAIAYANHCSHSRHAVIRVRDITGNVSERMATRANSKSGGAQLLLTIQHGFAVQVSSVQAAH